MKAHRRAAGANGANLAREGVHIVRVGGYEVAQLVSEKRLRARIQIRRVDDCADSRETRENGGARDGVGVEVGYVLHDAGAAQSARDADACGLPREVAERDGFAVGIPPPADGVEPARVEGGKGGIGNLAGGRGIIAARAASEKGGAKRPSRHPPPVAGAARNVACGFGKHGKILMKGRSACAQPFSISGLQGQVCDPGSAGVPPAEPRYPFPIKGLPPLVRSAISARMGFADDSITGSETAAVRA